MTELINSDMGLTGGLTETAEVLLDIILLLPSMLYIFRLRYFHFLEF